MTAAIQRHLSAWRALPADVRDDLIADIQANARTGERDEIAHAARVAVDLLKHSAECRACKGAGTVLAPADDWAKRRRVSCPVCARSNSAARDFGRATEGVRVERGDEIETLEDRKPTRAKKARK